MTAKWIVVKEAGRIRLNKVEISWRSWEEVDKSKLPRACFLIQGDPDKKSTWKLPVYEGAGEIGEGGMYTRRGPLNANAVRAARAAVAGARTGEAMSVPPSVEAELARLMRLVQAARERKE